MIIVIFMIIVKSVTIFYTEHNSPFLGKPEKTHRFRKEATLLWSAMRRFGAHWKSKGSRLTRSSTNTASARQHLRAWGAATASARQRSTIFVRSCTAVSAMWLNTSPIGLPNQAKSESWKGTRPHGCLFVFCILFSENRFPSGARPQTPAFLLRRYGRAPEPPHSKRRFFLFFPLLQNMNSSPFF